MRLPKMFARWLPILLGLTVLVAGCAATAANAAQSSQAAAQTAYQPQTRTFTVTSVPLAVHEMQGSMDFLQKDFAKGGILDGKEVYGFYPSDLIVYQGDTVNLTLVNPEDDPHTFTITELGVNVEMKAQSTTKASFVASKAGTYQFICAEPEHMPYMWGQLVVLPDSLAQ
jgi:plastocyanin